MFKNPDHGPARKSAPSVFISYARNNSNARSQLRDSLIELGLQVTGDWDLKHGPKYRPQLVDLIKRSDVFLALLSDHFAASTACHDEVNAAAEFGKRIHPVVVEDIKCKAELPPPVRSPQWAFLRAGDAYGETIQTIRESIYTDFSDIKEHTNLLFLAEQWKNSKRALLLRGKALGRATRWLERAHRRPPDWYPKPTPIQLEFHDASVKATHRRRVWATTGSLFAVAVALLGLRMLGIFSERATTAEETSAATQSAIESRRLAELSLAQIPFNPAQARQLSYKALNLSATDEALDARRQVNMLRGGIDADFDVGEIVHAGFLGDHAIVAVGRGATPQYAALWVECRESDGDYLDYQATLALSPRDGETLSFLTTSPGVEWVAAASESSVYIWRVEVSGPRRCGGLVEVNPPPEAPMVIPSSAAVTAVALDPRGRGLVTGHADGTTVLRKLPSGEQVATIPMPASTTRAESSSVRALAVRGGGDKIAVGTADNVYVWISGSAQNPWSIGVFSPVTALAFHPREELIAIGMKSRLSIKNAAALGTYTYSVREVLLTDSQPINAIAFSHDGQYLVSASEDSKVRVWEMEGIENPTLAAPNRNGDRLIVELVGHEGAARTLSVAQTGKLFVSGGRGGNLVVRRFPLPDNRLSEVAGEAGQPSQRENKSPSTPQITHPVVATTASVMVRDLDEAQATILFDVLNRHEIQYYVLDRPHGGVHQVATYPLESHLAETIVDKLRKAGLPAYVE